MHNKRLAQAVPWVVGSAIIFWVGYVAYMPFRSADDDKFLRERNESGQYVNPSNQARLEARLSKEIAVILSMAAIAFVACFFLARYFSWSARTRRRYALNIAKGLCPACGYDLTANMSGTCPECGRKTDRPLADRVPPPLR